MKVIAGDMNSVSTGSCFVGSVNRYVLGVCLLQRGLVYVLLK